jgi:3,4-dihydroxy 2-butanone 4-phosphate synthase
MVATQKTTVNDDRLEILPFLQDSSISAALTAIRQGQPICILDSVTREGETDMFFPGINMDSASLRKLRIHAGGELYMAIGSEVVTAFGLPYASDAWKIASDAYPILKGMDKTVPDMCQGTCSVGISLDHRSTKTGAPDAERSWTCKRFSQLAADALNKEKTEEAKAAFGSEFHVPGHIFLCQERQNGLKARQGHTELSISLARLAGVVPVMIGCVMLSNAGNNFGALDPKEAEQWALKNNVPFLNDEQIVSLFNSGNVFKKIKTLIYFTVPY